MTTILIIPNYLAPSICWEPMNTNNHLHERWEPHVLCLSLTCPLIGTQRPHYPQVTTPAAGSTEVHVVNSRQALIPQLLFGVDVFLKCSHLPRFLVSSVPCLVFFVGPWRLLTPRPVVSQGPAPVPLPLYTPDSQDDRTRILWFQPACWCGPLMWPVWSPSAAVR